jgi:hypothetical protein
VPDRLLQHEPKNFSESLPDNFPFFFFVIPSGKPRCIGKGIRMHYFLYEHLVRHDCGPDRALVRFPSTWLTGYAVNLELVALPEPPSDSTLLENALFSSRLSRRGIKPQPKFATSRQKSDKNAVPWRRSDSPIKKIYPDRLRLSDH